MTENPDETLKRKTARLEAVKQQAQQFVDSGGDLKAPEAVPLGMALLEAFADVAQELGKQSPEPEQTTEPKNLESFLKLFTFQKKSELERYCRGLVISSDDFVNFILACDFGLMKYKHERHALDHVPEGLRFTQQNQAALTANGVGLLTPDAQKAVTKISQMFEERKLLVGHIFYVPDLTEWHFFQFDQRDTEDEKPNHWKGGAHIHFLNWLWPNYDAKTLWADFKSGKDKMKDSLYIRYFDTARRQKEGPPDEPLLV